MKFKQGAVIFGLLAVGACAHAATYDIGTLPTLPAAYTQTVTPPAAPTSFSDTFTFTFPVAAHAASGSAVSLELGPYNIDNLQVSIFTAADNLVAQGSIGESSTLKNVALTAGDGYYYRVTGSVVGAGGGLYSFLGAAVAVPEPETYALMLAGVAAIGFLVFRRRG